MQSIIENHHFKLPLIKKQVTLRSIFAIIFDIKIQRRSPHSPDLLHQENLH